RLGAGPGHGASRGDDRRERVRMLGTKRGHLEIVDPDRAAAPRAGGDRELESRDVLDRPAAGGSPGEHDPALREDDAAPRRWELELPLVRPPRVLAARIDQLVLEVVRRSIAAYQEREGIV